MIPYNLNLYSAEDVVCFSSYFSNIIIMLVFLRKTACDRFLTSGEILIRYIIRYI